jgi:HEPN domain-containing protein
MPPQNPLTLEWIDKAEGDFATARRELRVRVTPNYDAVCFHAQQSAEKYMKALLQDAKIPFGRTHNLVALLDLLVPRLPGWDQLRTELQTLSTYAVIVRYPGDRANRAMARQSFGLCSVVRARARADLDLDE